MNDGALQAGVGARLEELTCSSTPLKHAVEEGKPLWPDIVEWIQESGPGNDRKYNMTSEWKTTGDDNEQRVVPWKDMPQGQRLKLLFMTGGWMWINEALGDKLEALEATGALLEAMQKLEFEFLDIVQRGQPARWRPVGHCCVQQKLEGCGYLSFQRMKGACAVPA